MYYQLFKFIKIVDKKRTGIYYSCIKSISVFIKLQNVTNNSYACIYTLPEAKFYQQFLKKLGITCKIVEIEKTKKTNQYD
jgi:hypothetical protein